MEEKEIRRGDIFYADLNPVVGSEQGGFRPVLVIQNNTGNEHSPTVIVAAVTSKPKTKLPTYVSLKNRKGLERDSVVLLEQIRTLDKKRLENYVGRIDRYQMIKIDEALRASTGVKKLDKPIEMCLCPVCAGVFYDSPDHFIQRTDKRQRKKEMCMFCKSRGGYDYLIRKKYY